MAEEVVLKAKVCIRHDDSTKWVEANPVLNAGEIGLESDTGRIKYGDGKSQWADLSYCSVVSIEENEIDNIFK